MELHQSWLYPPGPLWATWALVALALVAPPRLLCAEPSRAPLRPCGPGPCWPLWVLVGWALVGPLGPYWPGPCGAALSS